MNAQIIGGSGLATVKNGTPVEARGAVVRINGIDWRSEIPTTAEQVWAITMDASEIVEKLKSK